MEISFAFNLEISPRRYCYHSLAVTCTSGHRRHTPSQNEHNGHTINVDIATNYLPEVGKGFGAWLIDDYYEGSGYALRMDKILESGTLGFHELMVSAKTYTDVVITQKPANNLSPLASWSNAVAQTWLIPPFGR